MKMKMKTKKLSTILMKLRKTWEVILFFWIFLPFLLRKL